jgi:hypothetical protein
VNAGLITQWLASGALELPLPGGGATALRWLRLADLTEKGIVAGRLAEAHTDAVTIQAELDGPEPRRISCGVWTAEPRRGGVYPARATR